MALCGICKQNEGKDPKSHTCEINCGACGQYFDESEVDFNGNHLAEFCDASDEIETCTDCNQEYLSTESHDCPNVFCCGDCGKIVGHDEGESIQNGGFTEFIHRADLCSANNEIADCLICHTTENLLNDADRADYRNVGFIGVDFYPHICKNCFDLEKEKR